MDSMKVRFDGLFKERSKMKAIEYNYRNFEIECSKCKALLNYEVSELTNDYCYDDKMISFSFEDKSCQMFLYKYKTKIIKCPICKTNIIIEKELDDVKLTSIFPYIEMGEVIDNWRSKA